MFKLLKKKERKKDYNEGLRGGLNRNGPQRILGLKP